MPLIIEEIEYTELPFQVSDAVLVEVLQTKKNNNNSNPSILVLQSKCQLRDGVWMTLAYFVRVHFFSSTTTTTDCLKIVFRYVGWKSTRDQSPLFYVHSNWKTFMRGHVLATDSRYTSKYAIYDGVPKSFLLVYIEPNLICDSGLSESDSDSDSDYYPVSKKIKS